MHENRLTSNKIDRLKKNIWQRRENVLLVTIWKFPRRQYVSHIDSGTWDLMKAEREDTKLRILTTKNNWGNQQWPDPRKLQSRPCDQKDFVLSSCHLPGSSRTVPSDVLLGFLWDRSSRRQALCRHLGLLRRVLHCVPEQPLGCLSCEPRAPGKRDTGQNEDDNSEDHNVFFSRHCRLQQAQHDSLGFSALGG